MIRISDLSRWSISQSKRPDRPRKRTRYAERSAFESLESRWVMDGDPFFDDGGGPFREDGSLSSLSAGEILQLLVDMDLTTHNSVDSLLNTLTFDEVFTSMTNLDVMEELLRIDLVTDYADIDDLVGALPAAGIDASILRPDGLLTALTVARGGSLLTKTATAAKADFQLMWTAAPQTFLNVFDARALLELFDDSMVTSPGAAMQPLYAFATQDVQAGLSYLLRPYQFDVDYDSQGNPVIPDIQEAVQEIMQLPAGFRGFHSGLHVLPGYGTYLNGLTHGMIDPIDTQGNQAEYFMIWSDSWEQIISQRYDDWLGDFKSAGGQLDMFYLDLEEKLTSWQELRQQTSRFATPTGKSIWQVMREDPRWGPVEAELLAYGLTSTQLANIANWNTKGTEAMIWNGVMERRRADYINRTLYDTVREHFPNIRFSNFSSFHHNQTMVAGTYNRFTETWLSIGAVAGNRQAKSLYANAAVVSTPTLTYESTPPSQAAIATIQGVSGVVTVTTHRDITGLQPGATIRIYESVPKGAAAYIGIYTVQSVTGPRTLTFLKPGDYPLVTLPNATATAYVEMYDGWNAMVYDMKFVRTQVGTSNIPLHPVMGAPGWSLQFRGIDYTHWSEEMRHVALHDLDEIIFWNSIGMDPQGQGNVLANSVLAEVQPLIGFADRIALTRTHADWNDGYLLSGMETNGRRIWRFTPDDNQSLSISTGVNTTFTVGTKTLTIPNSYIYTAPGAMQSKGYWVVQHTATTELTASVDQVLLVLADAVGGGEASILPISTGQWNPNLTWVDVRTGDFDGDGDSDIVGRAQSTGEWWIGRMQGAAMTTELWATWSPGVTWVDVNVGDFDGDGDSDLAGRVQETGDWWVARSSGTSFASELWANWSTGVSWASVNVADFDGDGDDDLVGRVAQSGDWWVGKSSGTGFVNQFWGNFSAGLQWTDFRVRDFNGDGKADVAARSVADGQWWVGRSSGTNFVNELWGGWSTAVTWVDVLVGDFDGDGDADLLGRVLQSGQWWLAQSNGNHFTNLLWGGWSPTLTFTDVRAIDLDGDGRDDVIGRVLLTGDWWKGQSQLTGITYEYLANRNESLGYIHQLVMDLDGDGHDDDLLSMAGTTGDWWWDF